MLTIISGFRRHRSRPLLRFTRRQWRRLLEELRRRGNHGDRESGAFFLGRSGSNAVSRIVYLDDLDPHCLQGGIRLDGLAYSRLWDICEHEALVVLGDVHTHPGDFVRQSGIDAENPMVSRRGHIAIIVPHLAMQSVKSRDIGVHQYDGADGWETWLGRDAADRVDVRGWW